MRRNNSLPVVILFAVLIVLAAYLPLRKPAVQGTVSPSGTGSKVNLSAGRLPSPSLTPGDMLISEKIFICRSGYIQTVRKVPSSLKAQVSRSYGIASHKPGEYEVDLGTN